MAHVEFAPLLRERIAAQHAFEREKRESYSFALGDYTDSELLWDSHSEQKVGDYRLYGREVFIADYLQTLLNRRDNDKPVVAVDIGGGVGVSWLRLGGVFRDEIESGQMVLAVTNLDGIERYTILRNHIDQENLQATHELLAQNGALVQHLPTTFSLLHKQSVVMPDGSTLPLKGNASLVHERLSLTLWTQLPEIHIHRAGQLLADDGLFITRPRPGSETSLDNAALDRPSSKWYGVQLAQRALESTFGLTKHTQVQTGVKAGAPLKELLYAAPHAPLIHVD